MPEKYYAFDTREEADACIDQVFAYHMEWHGSDEVYSDVAESWMDSPESAGGKWRVPVCYEYYIPGDKKGIRRKRNGQIEEYDKIVRRGNVYNPWGYSLVTVP